MTNPLDSLNELHKLDQRIIKLKERIDSIPERLFKLNENFTKRETEIEREKESLKSNEVARKKIEIDVEEFENKISTYKLQLQKVKTNEEYRAMESQIEFSKNKISELETKEIEIFDEIDRMKNELVELQKRHFSEKERFETEMKNLEEEQTRGKGILEELEKQRNAMVSEFDIKLLKKYEKIKNAKGTALAQIFLSDPENVNSKKNFWVCGGCNSMVAPHLVEEVKMKKDIAQCESCGRILFFE